MEYLSDAGHPTVIARLVHDYDIRPKKGAGQNFFSDPDMLDAIADAGMIGKDDWVLEIGPGLGVWQRGENRLSAWNWTVTFCLSSQKRLVPLIMCRSCIRIS